VGRAVVVAEVVGAAAGTDEQGVNDDGVADDVSRRVDEADTDDWIHDDRGEQDAALTEFDVPVAGDEDIAAGRPAVVRGDPDVARLDAGPVASAPDVARAAPVPVTRDIEAVGRRRLAGRGQFWHGRGLRQIGDVRGRLLALGGGGPETGHILPAIAL